MPARRIASTVPDGLGGLSFKIGVTECQSILRPAAAAAQNHQSRFTVATYRMMGRLELSLWHMKLNNLLLYTQ